MLIVNCSFANTSYFLVSSSMYPDTIKEDSKADLNERQERIELEENQRYNLNSNVKAKADKLFESYGYMAATDLYGQLAKEGNLAPAVMEKLAESYFYNGETEDAAYWYAQFIKDTDNPTNYLHYAQVLQSNGKCEDAVRWYDKYLAATNDRSRSFILDCEELKKIPQKNAKITNLENVNTENLEYSAISYGKGIVFTSTRGVPKATRLKDSWTKSNFADLFYMEKDENGQYKNARPLTKRINKKYHDGVATFDNTNTLMIFSRNNRTGKNENGIIDLKLYAAKNPKSFWADVSEDPIQLDLKKPIKDQSTYWLDQGELSSLNSDDFSTCHPSLANDDRRLYFSSNRPGGYGGMDIYVSENIDGEWTAPVNLGPTINSSGNELFPYIADDEKLYYASDGHQGLGGLDVFVGQKKQVTDENTWDIRENLGTPFNSPKDDFGFYISKEKDKGFLTSNRDGGKGGDDIYEWEMGTGEVLELEEDEFDRRICVFDESNDNRIEGVSVSIQPIGTNNNNSDATLTLKPLNNNKNEYVLGIVGVNENGGTAFVTDKRGQFRFRANPGQNYRFVVEKQGYMLQRSTVSTAELMEGTEFCIAIAKKECLLLKGTVQSKNYHKSIAGATVKLLDKCRGGYMETTSDADGHFEFCVECDCDYQVMAEKMYFKSGSTDISTTSENLNDCNDLDEIRTLVELEAGDLNTNNTVLSYQNKNGYTSPNNNGQNPNVLPQNPAQMSREDLRRYFLGEADLNFQVGQSFDLRDVYYDYDKYNIRSDASNELDYLIAVMNMYPSMEIMLASHTDSRGSHKYNSWLSKKRANAAMRYLVENGIETHRIHNTKGFGETQLVNGCEDGIDCLEEEHQLNRRTEVRVVRLNPNEKLEKIGR